MRTPLPGAIATTMSPAIDATKAAAKIRFLKTNSSPAIAMTCAIVLLSEKPVRTKGATASYQRMRSRLTVLASHAVSPAIGTT